MFYKGISSMSEKLLLIDGHSIATRAFYGVPDLTNSKGVHTNAVYGFINIFLNVYDDVAPDYAVVAFDVHQPTFRHEMYSAYKGTRKGLPEELHEQIPVLEEALAAMNIKVATAPGYEADDILGTYAKAAEKEGINAVVLSGDRDLLQLASETTMIMIPKTKAFGNEIEKYYAEDVMALYGVTPSEFIDMKALMGDQSDNIPGIPGIGEKTAAKIITEYGSLENAYEHASQIKPPRAGKNLEEYIDQGRLSKTLATIVTDAPVPFDFHEGKIPQKDVFFNDDSYNIFKRLELKRLLERFDKESIAEASKIDLEVLSASCFDPDEIKGDKAGIFVDEEALFFAAADEGKITVYQSEDNGKDTKEKLSGLLMSGKEVYCFGLKSLLHSLGLSGIRLENIHDLEVMAYLLDPLANSYTYDSVSKDHLGHIIPSKAELLGKTPLCKAAADPEKKEAAFKVLAYGADTAFKAFPVLKDVLMKKDMWQLYIDIEMPLIYLLCDMESEGIAVNKKTLLDLSDMLSGQIADYENKIYEQAGEKFNINSPKQLGSILFEKLKLPHGKKTKSGYSTAADVLEKLAPDYPIVSDILYYRQLAKLRSTYTEGLIPYIKEDGRIHTTFNQTITATGRLSCTDPNLQNIPIRREMGQEIRRAFVAKEGCIFIDADYSQIELRLMAHLSGDGNLISAYNSDADIHKITASQVFKTPLEEVTRQQRSNAKAVNFGIIYGISSFGLSQDLSITRKEASEYIDQYFETYPGVREYLNGTVARAKKTGYVTTIFNRRRPIPELSSSNFMQRSFGERAAMNSPLQGSAADIIKIAMIAVDREMKKRGLRSKLILQIHDELLVETYEDEISEVEAILEEKMKQAADLKVSLEVGIGKGKSWYEAH